MTKLRICRSHHARLRGLLGTEPSEDLVLLVPCCDIHTFGMAYALDVAFVDGHARVIRTYRNVEPGSRLRCNSAVAVLERAANKQKKWFAPCSFTGQVIYKAVRERKSA